MDLVSLPLHAIFSGIMSFNEADFPPAQNSGLTDDRSISGNLSYPRPGLRKYTHLPTARKLF